MEKSLDKDIEVINKFVGRLNMDPFFADTTSFEYLKQPLENVLSELSNLKWKNEIYVKSIKSHKETIEKQQKELETYKKIAEKLAEQWFSMADILILNGNHIHSAIEIIDWARKEVEKDIT